MLALNASFFEVSLVTALTQGVVVAWATISFLLLLAYVFKLGNSRRRPSKPVLGLFLTLWREAPDVKSFLADAYEALRAPCRARDAIRARRQRLRQRRENKRRWRVAVELAQEGERLAAVRASRFGLEPPPPPPPPPSRGAKSQALHPGPLTSVGYATSGIVPPPSTPRQAWVGAPLDDVGGESLDGRARALNFTQERPPPLPVPAMYSHAPISAVAAHETGRLDLVTPEWMRLRELRKACRARGLDFSIADSEEELQGKLARDGSFPHLNCRVDLARRSDPPRPLTLRTPHHLLPMPPPPAQPQQPPTGASFAVLAAADDLKVSNIEDQAFPSLPAFPAHQEVVIGGERPAASQPGPGGVESPPPSPPTSQAEKGSPAAGEAEWVNAGLPAHHARPARPHETERNLRCAGLRRGFSSMGSINSLGTLRTLGTAGMNRIKHQPGTLRNMSTVGIKHIKQKGMLRRVGTVSSGEMRRAKNAEGARFAVVSMAAVRQKKKIDALWRGPAERCVRLVFAWVFHLTVCALLLFYALVLSLKFGESENATLFGAWGAAYLWTAVLLEPVIIFIVVGLPSIANEETRLGRCCLRVKWLWDELLSP